MSTTTTTQETVSDAQQDDVVLERPRSTYGYLGRDGDDYHHHLDRVTNTVYITESEYERFLPENALTFWISIPDETHTVVDLESPADLEAWIDHVDSHVGWAEQPADLQVLLIPRGDSA